jgi:hypothetical protein
MTFLSQYLRAEQPDKTEPAGFYIPGAKDWTEAVRWRWPRAKRNQSPADELPDPVEEEK